VIGGDEILVDIVMARVALVGADVGGAGDIGELHHGAADGTAGNHHQERSHHNAQQRRPSAPSGGESVDDFPNEFTGYFFVTASLV
jgi:hypothetical protein